MPSRQSISPDTLYGVSESPSSSAEQSTVRSSLKMPATERVRAEESLTTCISASSSRKETQPPTAASPPTATICSELAEPR